MPKSNQSQEKTNAAIWAAVITGIVSLVVGFLGFPPLVKYLDSRWNPTPTLLVVPSPSETFTVSPDILPSPTATPTFVVPSPVTPTLTQPPDSGTMTVQLIPSYLEGKAPFTPTFRAGTSFVTYSDGKVETCEFANVCSYTWDVREKNGKTIFGPESGSGVFSYTFHKKGDYTVLVYVCRGQACSYTAATVTVK